MSDWSEGSYSPVYDPESDSWYDPNTVYQSRIDDFNREVYWNSINAGSDPAGPVDATKTVTFPDGSKMYLDTNGQVVGSTDARAGSENSGASLTTSDRVNLLAQSMGGLASAAWKNFSGAFKKSDGTIDYGKLLGAAAGLGAGMGLFGGGDDKPKGYQGKVPDLAVAREQVANTYDPNRRAGSGGLRYFSDTQFLPEKDTAGLAAAKTAAGTQATGLASLNTANPARQATSPLNFAPLPPPGPAVPATTTPAAATAAAPASDVIKSLPVPTYNTGGIATLARGRYLDGPTDGMADKLPANIDGKQEARLSHGEFVIPADVVGHLGNGNSTAGAQRLYAMMDRIRQARTGTKKQGKQINPDKYVPA